MHPAKFFTREGDSIRCTLCPQSCRIREGGRGLCNTRARRDGQLFAEGYGRVLAMHLDPIEKKPLYHFLPGSSTFSIGFAGCNLFCPYCQNDSLSRALPRGEALTPHCIADAALRSGAPSISYTYSEPLVQYEFVYDTAALAHRAGLKNILVTNGYINPEPLTALLTHIDAMNIDVKSSRTDAFARTCKGRLDTVFDTVFLAAPRCHVEVTSLMVPGLCDVPDVHDIAERLTPLNVPLHISRYFPRGAGPSEPTKISDMRAAQSLARQYLTHVYLGNV